MQYCPIIAYGAPNPNDKLGLFYEQYYMHSTTTEFYEIFCITLFPAFHKHDSL
jgi:hypothetical protein